MNEFPDFLRFSIASPVNEFMKVILDKYSAVFDYISTTILWMLMLIESFLLWVPWWLVVILVIFLGCRVTKSWLTGAVMGIMLTAVGSLGMWDLMMQTLAIVGVAVFIAVVLGIPTGILMASNSKLEAFLRPVLDAMQTMPSFVYLIPALMFFGLGKVPGIFATLIYALPPIIRLTNLGIRQVSEDVIEAGKAFGATRMQLLFKIQLPLAMPSVMSGVNQTTMMALAMVVIASMIGARGLGEPVLIAIGRIDVGRGLEAGICIVILAIVIDRLLQGLGNQQSSGQKQVIKQ
ncbi:ABC transporter permease [Desulfoscipio gibsoniae]|uniref:ABC-type proline/glycine betaine transport system, permease component n=1 Tax=Desulfoscipio gibsoniae DSM 7213 TaxID=767817 RepID=R4KKW3_9FIRM|nr:proline/glycine betaine ABC transporter permease [Desulfoscipio gibsoniae]AGL03299.1 ABC-type proline/glycine betaine transport system, permease component [Desulfoscipio gibsoniae DSM 7213]